MVHDTPNMRLPIDLVPGSNPPKFRWQHTVSTIGGTTEQECEGLLPPSVETAVRDLVAITKRTLMECAGLREQVASMTDRIARQSELLSKNAERIAEIPTPTQTVPQRGKK